MPNSRHALANAALASGGRLSGETLHESNEAFFAARMRLSSANVQPGEVVGLAGMSSAELLVLIIATWSLDAVPWALHSTQSSLNCSVLLNGQDAVRIDAGVDRRISSAVALLHSTSGSTASAKTACRSVASVLAEAEGYKSGLDLSASDVVGIPLPVSHSLASGVAISCLLAGCDIYLDHSGLPSAVASMVDRGVISKLILTPALAALLIQTRKVDSHSPKCLLVAAGYLPERLEAALVARFGGEVFRGYGSTETGGTFIGRKGIGSPVSGVRIIWPPPGTEGQLVLRMPTPVFGYAGTSARTSLTWRTGDVVSRDDCGSVHFLGRASEDVVRLNGKFIDLSDIRTSLSLLPGISDFMTVVLPDEKRPGIEKLYLLVAAERLTAIAISRHLAGLTQGTAVAVIVCQALPRNELGKLDRIAATRLVGETR